jgi:hypothetical protein
VKILIVSGSDACEVSVVTNIVTVKYVVFKISSLLHLVNFRYGRKSDITGAKFRRYERVLLSVNSVQ